MEAEPICARTDLTERVLALTFDDGPSQWTEPILNLLNEEDVRATFFVIGDNLPGKEDILRRIHREGHEVGNHTLRHPPLDHPELDSNEIRRELTLTSSAIEDVTDAAPRVFRPPYFRHNATVREIAAECGFNRIICASAWTNDWDETDSSAIIEQILAKIRVGSIIDLHDGRPPHDPPFASDGTGGSRETREPTVAAVGALVPRLKDDGYRFLTVSELLVA